MYSPARGDRDLDLLLLKNPIKSLLARLGYMNSSWPVVRFAQNQTASPLNPKVNSSEGATAELSSVSRREFLLRFLEPNNKDPEIIDNDRALALTVVNIFAGLRHDRNSTSSRILLLVNEFR
jgi:hypothetical protein